jgi:serine/threonine-protein kinase
LVAERYRVRDVIQRGGMGVIHAATHEVLEQDIALKVLLPSLAHEPAVVDRFVREARAAAKLKSDNVVRVFDVGIHDGLPYMAMELLEGSDLSDLLGQRGALPVAEAVDIALEALEGIIAAHAAGIVHRDLKPSNLFLERRGERSRVKILDFGISKLGAHVAPAMTASRLLLGSPGYMSPEQVRSARGVDIRSDVWSLGVILWEMLTGEVAFDGETIGDVFAKIREEPLAHVCTRRPEVPRGLGDVVVRCLERDRDKRYPDASSLRDALRAFGSAPAPRPSAPVRPSADERIPEAFERDAEDVTQVDPRVLVSSSLELRPSESSPSNDSPLPRRSGIAANTAAGWTASQRQPSRRHWALVAGAVVVALALTIAVANRMSDDRAAHPSGDEPVASPPDPTRSLPIGAAQSPAAPEPSAEPSSPPSAASSAASRAGAPTSPPKRGQLAPTGVPPYPSSPRPPATPGSSKEDWGL